MLGLCPILSCIYWDDHVVFKYFILLIWVLNQHWNSLFLFFFSLFIDFLNLNLFILIGGYEKVGKAWLLSSVAFCDFGFELGSA